MGKRPWRMWRRLESPAYTRKEYIKGVPGLKIREFDMGNPSGDFDTIIYLVAKEECQISHAALEAARVAANKYIASKVGRNNYHLKIMVYPHHIIRENKMATGAGADRIQEGMRRAFGKPVGAAARVRRNQPLIMIRTREENIPHAKEALRRASYKFPTPCAIVVEKIQKVSAS